MLAETERLSRGFVAGGLPRIVICIGSNTVSMNVGDMGSEFRRDYTVLGYAVTHGARLEGSGTFVTLVQEFLGR